MTCLGRWKKFGPASVLVFTFLAFVTKTYPQVSSFGAKGFSEVKLAPSAGSYSGLTKLNQHAIYSFEPDFGLRDSGLLDVSLRFRIEDSNMSRSDFPGIYSLPLVTAGTMAGTEYRENEKPEWKWRLSVGNYLGVTVGNGLTVRDLNLKGFNFGSTLGPAYLNAYVWTQGYLKREDMYLLSMNDRVSANNRFGLNILIRKHENSELDFSNYFLPYFDWNLLSIGIYGEAGLKIREKGSYAWVYDENESGTDLAFLFGATTSNSVGGWRIEPAVEYRYYSKGFIPREGAENTFYEILDQRGKSIDNWIDYLFLRSPSQWWYARVYLESPSLFRTSFFLENELLVIDTKQKEILDKSETQALISFHPSYDYYAIGFNYRMGKPVSMKFGISNKLMNSNPALNYYSSDPFLKYSNSDVQYKNRFYPAKTPYVLVCLEWNVSAVKGI